MKTKWKIIISAIAVATIFSVIGFFAGVSYKQIGFLVCEYNGQILTYTIQNGKITGMTGDMGVFEIKTSDINSNNNKQALEQLENNVREAGGKIISSSIN